MSSGIVIHIRKTSEADGEHVYEYDLGAGEAGIFSLNEESEAPTLIKAATGDDEGTTLYVRSAAKVLRMLRRDGSAPEHVLWAG